MLVFLVPSCAVLCVNNGSPYRNSYFALHLSLYLSYCSLCYLGVLYCVYRNVQVQE